MAASADPGPRPHFQSFAPAPGMPVRWRLLGGNNRELGRSAEEFVDATAATAAIAALVARLDLLVPCVALERNGWTWSLQLVGADAVRSVAPLDRRSRAVESHRRFVEQAAQARPGAALPLVTGHRRLRGGRDDAVIDLRRKSLVGGRAGGSAG